MDYRTVGKTDLRVSVLGFGCASVGSRAGAGESRRALELAMDNGITYFDTADMYGVGGSEEILAKVFAGKRDKVVIASKCGYTFSTRLKAVAWVKPLLRPLVTRLKGVNAAAASAMASQRSQNFEPKYIESCVHGSLSRLKTDRIDLFYLHDPSMAVVERGDALEKLRAMKQAGKVRHIGISCDADVAARALREGDTGLSAVQVNANLLEQEAIRDVLPLARTRGVGVIARQPFAHGRLMEAGDVAGVLGTHGLPKDGAYLAALALRFLREQEGVSCVLPGMMKPAHIRANIAGIAGGPITDAERAAITALGNRVRGGSVQG